MSQTTAFKAIVIAAVTCVGCALGSTADESSDPMSSANQGTSTVSFRFRAGTSLDMASFDESPSAFGSFCYLQVGKWYPLLGQPTKTVTQSTGKKIYLELPEAPLTRQGFACSFASGWVRQDLIEIQSSAPSSGAGGSSPGAGGASSQGGASSTSGGATPGKPARVQEFLSDFADWIDGRPYLLGGSCKGSAAGDCSNCPTVVLRNMGLPVVGNQADWDTTNFVSCKAGDYRPGDLILMGYSCSNPDHWVALSTVKDKWNAVSTSNRIVDQSSDCAPHCGEGPMRSNLAKRMVCACARHKSFQAAWNDME